MAPPLVESRTMSENARQKKNWETKDFFLKSAIRRSQLIYTHMHLYTLLEEEICVIKFSIYIYIYLHVSHFSVSYLYTYHLSVYINVSGRVLSLFFYGRTSFAAAP